MSLILARPTAAKLTFRKTWQPMDADAAAYITAVETADGQALEQKTKIAIDNFVLGCKADGIWSAIKASCILAGARTLNGALVPLVGTAPTNVGGLFVQADYNRKTGLVGDGTSKALNSNRAANADPINSSHFSVYKTTTGNSGCYIGNLTASHDYLDYASGFRFASRNIIGGSSLPQSTTGLIGLSRASSSGFSYRIASSTSSTLGAGFVGTGNFLVFNRTGGDYFSSARLAFYSIGESLDLALLDARVTALITAFGAAIP